ncbi:hypothetical protein BFW01_g12900 [Lasiodiplodia theobromae]|nr:hypothetical protein BFW01_g12900 [Lasiodiplodia theobromae]
MPRPRQGQQEGSSGRPRRSPGDCHQNISGLEVLGAVASASQISFYVCNIVAAVQAIRRELREAPQRIQQRTKHLSFLLSIINSIQTNQLFHTSEVENHLKDIQERIYTLRLTLESSNKPLKDQSLRKVWRALETLRAETQILKSFDALESEKSSLLLFIAGAYGAKLHEVYQLAVDIKMDPSSRRTTETLVPKLEAEKHNAENSQALCALRSPATNTSLPCTSPTEGIHGRNQAPTLRDESASKSAHTSTAYTNLWTNNMIKGNGNKVTNGNISNGHSGVHQRSQWQGNGVEGDGNEVINGNVFGKTQILNKLVLFYEKFS